MTDDEIIAALTKIQRELGQRITAARGPRQATLNETMDRVDSALYWMQHMQRNHDITCESFAA